MPDRTIPEPTVSTTTRSAAVIERIDAVRGAVERAGVAGALLGSRRDTAWLTLGGELHVVLESEDAVAPILVTPDSVVVISPVNEAARIAEEELPDLPIEMITVPWHDPSAIRREATRIAGSDALLAGEQLEAVMEPLRSRLGPVEHERMRWLGAQATAAFDAMEGRLQRGDTEAEAASWPLGPLAAAGIRAPVVLAAADERLARYRHPLPTARRVEARLMVVLVAERWGLHVAGTRIVDVTPPPDEIAARDGAVAAVLEAMVAASRPGATLGDILGVGREAYAREGFPDEWLLHHQGGTIGYRGRERIATPGDETVLEEGMAVAWNPSITGAKTESTALVGLGDGGAAETILSP